MTEADLPVESLGPLSEAPHWKRNGPRKTYVSKPERDHVWPRGARGSTDRVLLLLGRRRCRRICESASGWGYRGQRGAFMGGPAAFEVGKRAEAVGGDGGDRGRRDGWLGLGLSRARLSHRKSGVLPSSEREGEESLNDVWPTRSMSSGGGLHD